MDKNHLWSNKKHYIQLCVESVLWKQRTRKSDCPLESPGVAEVGMAPGNTSRAIKKQQGKEHRDAESSFLGFQPLKGNIFNADFKMY